MQKRAHTDVYVYIHTRARGEVFCSLLSRPDVYKTCFFLSGKCEEEEEEEESGKTNFSKERERETLLFWGKKIALIIIQ